MTPERAKELLPVITAFAEGKTIQFKSKQDGKWTDSIHDLSFNNSAAFYRVKPEKVQKISYLVVNRYNGVSGSVFPSSDSAENYITGRFTCKDDFAIVPVTYEVELK